MEGSCIYGFPDCASAFWTDISAAMTDAPIIRFRSFMDFYFLGWVVVMEMLFTGCPFSSMKRTQKSLIPGPLMTAPRKILRPFFRVRRGEVQSSFTIRRSPERITASSPLSHHMEAELEPTARRTLSICSGLSMMVTAQKRTP